MRMAIPTGIGALLLVACGGGAEESGQKPADHDVANPDTAVAQNPSAGAGDVVEVRMTGNGTTVAQYEPDSLTIAPGTTLRFINVSGGPHNVSFWEDSIPSGGREPLDRGMTNTIGSLQGPLLTEPNATYDVSFAGAPAGEYKGYCVPHLAIGMRIWITVE